MKKSYLIKRCVSMLFIMLLVFFMLPVQAFAMQLFVYIDYGERTIALEAEPTDRVEDVKALIHDREGIYPDDQVLMFAGERLENGNRLRDYGIHKGDTLHLLVKTDEPGCTCETVDDDLTSKPYDDHDDATLTQYEVIDIIAIVLFVICITVVVEVF